MFTQSEREQLVNLYIGAKEGSKEAQDFLMKKYTLKIWTHQELKGLFYVMTLKKGVLHVQEEDKELPKMDNRYVPERKMMLRLPQPDGDYLLANVRYMDDLGEGYYLFGLMYEGNGYPHDDHYTSWIIQFDGTEFRPLFDISSWSMQDLIERAKTYERDDQSVDRSISHYRSDNVNSNPEEVKESES
jgi:hypothetical protein